MFRMLSLLKKISQKYSLVRRSTVIEMAIFFAAALILDYFFGIGDRFFNFSPHPFWIIILLVAVQYGTTEGLLCVVVATVVLLFFNLPEQGALQDMFEYWMVVVKNPVMWFLSAVCLGELSLRHQRAKMAAEHNLQAVLEREKIVLSAFEMLERKKETLEKQVASEVNTSLNTLSAMKMAQASDPQTVLNGVADIIRMALRPKQFSVFTVVGSSLKLQMSSGWISPDLYPRTYSSHSKLYREVIEKHKVLCCSDLEQEEILGGDGVLAGPLMHPDETSAIGLLKVEGLDFRDLTITGLGTFQALCNWIGSVYSNAMAYQALEVQNSALMKTVLPALRNHSFASELEALALAKEINWSLDRWVNSELSTEWISKMKSAFPDADFSSEAPSVAAPPERR